MYIQQLRAARALLGMEHAELSECAGVSPQIIKRIEEGRIGVNVTVETLDRILDVFDGLEIAFTEDGRSIGVSYRHELADTARFPILPISSTRVRAVRMESVCDDGATRAELQAAVANLRVRLAKAEARLEDHHRRSSRGYLPGF